MINIEERFPIYRRTPDRKHFYRIDGLDRFTEVQVIGRRAVLHIVEASQYPEHVRIREMIEGDMGRYLALLPEEWSELLRTYELDKPTDPS